ncbi:pilus assembly protein [Hyphococcus flavus]|uniref:Pilus assembly protein n=1 Tax=Hyphococcus flavus TaxID=1866326 RepID=A0AAF0CFV5_9PROT|nr:TadE/TadG family type IV pilus assembly protein [Hyphococcus flavus]WDI29997.1 pilus assembly protein [Hyphococcus flavus]
MINNIRCSIRTLLLDRAGVAAMEFALIAPILVVLFFGVVESADALARSRQVTLAANTLADLAAQESEIQTSDLDDLFDGVEQIMETGGAPANVTLVSVGVDADGDPIVLWSRNNSGAAPYARGAAYAGLPATVLIDDGASIIVSEIDYNYTSKLTQKFVKTIPFERMATRWPRRSIRIRLCSSAGSCQS